ncbi:MAG: QueT transporter family protein [Oscillospiraceae bacterium]|jgi:uncharacterized membrane protein|nr:QueT transporter family protein [Oscillospiraceae bacterium]
MSENRKRLAFLAQAAVIAALYAGLALAPGVSAVAFGPFQFRVAEALTVLPALTFAAVPGLALGCALANGFGLLLGVNTAGAWDVLLGSAATLLAALCSYALRKFCVKGAPALAALPPVLLNGLVVGAELSLVLRLPFWATAGEVALGEFAVVSLLGLPLAAILKRAKIFEKSWRL